MLPVRPTTLAYGVPLRNSLSSRVPARPAAALALVDQLDLDTYHPFHAHTLIYSAGSAASPKPQLPTSAQPPWRPLTPSGSSQAGRPLTETDDENTLRAIAHERVVRDRPQLP